MINMDNINSVKNEINLRIKDEPKIAEHYGRRALLDLFFNSEAEVENDIERMLALSGSKEDAKFLSTLGIILLHGKKDISKTINIFSKAISIDPNNPKYYKQRASCFPGNECDNAEADYNKAIELEPNNPDHFIDRAVFLSGLNLIKKNAALDDYAKAITLDPINPKPYFKRAQFFEKLKKYKEAIFDYNKSIELDQSNSMFLFYRGSLHSQLKHLDKAIKDFNQAIKLNNFSDIHPAYAFFERAKLQEKLANFEDAIKDFNQAIELMNSNPDFYYYRGNLNFRLSSYMQAISDYNKVIEIDPHYRIGDSSDIDLLYGEVYAMRGEAYYKMNNYQQAYDDLFEAYKMNRELEGWHTDLNDIFEKLTEQQKAEARVEERDKVIADLSHSIKNLIATVIDPLENLKQNSEFQPQIIAHALRGANLIREIVNAMNLSYKGAIDDFYYDARHNTGNDSMSIDEMVVESMKQAVGNMFDGKYFRNFMVKYFPKKDRYIASKEEWEALSQAESLDAFMPFLNTWFFTPELHLGRAGALKTGNEKGSAVKLLILFQELILNAVKYSAYVKKEERFVRVRLTTTPGQILFAIENPFEPKNRVKTTGLGHVIINNFARLLMTTPKVDTEGRIYSVQIAIPNFWEFDL